MIWRSRISPVGQPIKAHVIHLGMTIYKERKKGVIAAFALRATPTTLDKYYLPGASSSSSCLDAAREEK